MDGLLAVPISGVDPDWLHFTFKPQIQRAIVDIQKGGVLWLHVDASAEGDYLLSYVETWMKSSGHPVGELRVSREDPLLFWEDLLGTPDRAARAWSWPSGIIIRVLNGSALPVRFLQERLAILASFCRAKGWILVLPVLREAIVYVRERGSPAAQVVVPPFSGVGNERRRMLIEAMVQANFPSPSKERASLISQLEGADPPATSRTELQAWIDFYRDKTDLAAALREAPPPPIPRYPLLPSDPPTADILQSRLKVISETLHRASDAFLAWSGRPLFRVLYEPPDPFQSDDPVHWFSGSISCLSCWLDAPDPALYPLLQYEYQPSSGNVEAVSPSGFYDILRRLRTAMQHGLTPGSPSDNETMDAVRNWYYQRCGTDKPARHHWRRLTESLLEDAQTAAARLAVCAAKVPTSSARTVIESQLRVQARSLSKEEWRSLVRESVKALAPTLDSDRVIDKYLPDMQKGLRESTVETAEVCARARELANEFVLLDAARCPLTPTDILGLGVPRGPQLGVIHRQIEMLWKENPSQSRDELFELARTLMNKA